MPQKDSKARKGKRQESPSPTAHPDHSMLSLEGTLGFAVLPLIWARKLRHRGVRYDSGHSVCWPQHWDSAKLSLPTGHTPSPVWGLGCLRNKQGPTRDLGTHEPTPKGELLSGNGSLPALCSLQNWVRKQASSSAQFCSLGAFRLSCHPCFCPAPVCQAGLWAARDSFTATLGHPSRTGIWGPDQVAPDWKDWSSFPVPQYLHLSTL